MNRSKSTLVINLLGGPGIGKTAMMNSVMAELRWRGESAEIAPEYAKTVVWDGNTSLLEDQITIFAMQYRSINRLNGKVDFIVTDSPLILSLIYGKMNSDLPDSFYQLVEDASCRFTNMNVFLTRNSSVPYEQAGRVHDENSARIIDKKIENDIRLLKSYYRNSYNVTIDTGPHNAKTIADMAIKRHNY